MTIIEIMFENGVFKEKYKNIIEIYPHKAMNSKLFNIALKDLIRQDYKLYKMSDNWIRAFKK